MAADYENSLLASNLKLHIPQAEERGKQLEGERRKDAITGLIKMLSFAQIRCFRNGGSKCCLIRLVSRQRDLLARLLVMLIFLSTFVTEIFECIHFIFLFYGRHSHLLLKELNKYHLDKVIYIDICLKFMV